MLASLREESSNSRYDGVHALLFVAGAFLGLFLLTLWSRTLGQPTMPEVLQTVVPWQFANVKPEPNEHALFNVGLILVPLCSMLTWFAVRKFFLNKEDTVALRLAATLAIGTILLWLITLLSSSDASFFSISTSWYGAPWTLLFPLTVSSMIAIALGCIAVFARWKFPMIALSKPGIWEAIIIGLFIVFLAYDPLSLLPGKPTDTSDDMWFIMPAWDILHGKHLLVDSESQYGLGIFYLLSILFHFVGSTIQSLKTAEIFAHAAYYTIVYVLVRSVCKTRQGAVLAFFFIIGGTIMRNELRFETYAEPSMTRLRNFWDVPLLLALFKEQQTGKMRWFITACAVAAIAFLYNTDIGLSIAMITCIWAFGLPFFQALSIDERFKAIMMRIAIAATFMIGGWLLFSLFLSTIGGSWPDWSLNYYYVKLYLAGFGAMPIPIVGAYWAVLGVEMTAIITACASWLLGRNLRNAPFLLAVGLYGFLTFNYYLNRSFISNLWSVSLPACLCGILLFQAYREQCNNDGTSLCSRVIRWPLMTIAGAFIGINLWIVGIGTHQLAATRYADVAVQPTDTTFETQMQESVDAITARVPEGEGAAIISQQEPLYLLAANRSSAFHVPMLSTVFTIDKMNDILSQFAAENHPYLFVEHAYTRCPMCDAVKNALAPLYTFEKTEGRLDVYARTPSL